MILKDKYVNIKNKASATNFEKDQVIAALRDKLTECYREKGMKLDVSKQMATLATGDMQRYKQMADKPSSYRTPTLSDISSPD